MAWQPMQPREPAPVWPSPRARKLISRGTLLLVTLALWYGSYRCIRFSIEAGADAVARDPVPAGGRRLGGGALPLAIGIGLGLLGLSTALAVVMPPSFFDRFVRPPREVSEEMDRAHSMAHWSRWF